MESSTHRKPILIIPACGNSQRFKDKGINTPKGLIQFIYEGRMANMIQHVVPEGDFRVIVVVKHDDAALFRDQLPLGFEVFSIESSLGQMDTVLQALDSDRIPHDQKILVVNCDDKFPKEVIQKLYDLEAQAGTVVFETEPNDRYGYIDNFPNFEYGAEKNPISRYALAGAFMFKDKNTFLEAVYTSVDKWQVTHNGEYYLSGLFRHLKGLKTAVLVRREEIIDFGTPEALSIAVGHDIFSIND